MVDHVVALAHDGEDFPGAVARVQAGEARRRERRPWTELELGQVDVGQRHEVSLAQRSAHVVDVVVLQFQLALEEVGHAAWHVLGHLQPHHRRKLLLAQLLRDHVHQIVGLVLAAGHVRVARHPERIGGHDAHARKERAQVVEDDLLQRHEMERVIQRHPTGPAGRDLHPRKDHLVAHRVGEEDAQAETQVGQEGERVARVHGQRRQHGVDLAAVVVFQRGLLHIAQLVVAVDAQTVFGQRGQHVVEQAITLAVDHGPHGFGHQLQLGIRRPALEIEIGYPRRFLPLETAHALAKELVQIAGGDGQILEPLQQRMPPVQRLVEHPPVEVQPRQFPVVDHLRRAQFVQRQRGQIHVGHVGAHLGQHHVLGRRPGCVGGAGRRHFVGMPVGHLAERLDGLWRGQCFLPCPCYGSAVHLRRMDICRKTCACGIGPSLACVNPSAPKAADMKVDYSIRVEEYQIG